MNATIQKALLTARARIALGSESAALDAQVLLGEVLNVDRAYILAHPEHQLRINELERFMALVERCATGEPLAYLIGRKAFYDRELLVTPAVLVPRPETELLLEYALAFARFHPLLTAVDVGTGSGALAVTFAAHVPQAAVYATDVSPAALGVAQENALRERVSITFYHGDLLLPLIERGIKADLIMANLPYIPSLEVPTLAVSQYEPLLALDGGEDGLALVRRLLEQAVQVVPPTGLIVLEIGAGQGSTASYAASTVFPDAIVEVELDYAGHDRVVVIRQK